jgi:hypothetical protein
MAAQQQQSQAQQASGSKAVDQAELNPAGGEDENSFDATPVSPSLYCSSIVTKIDLVSLYAHRRDLAHRLLSKNSSLLPARNSLTISSVALVDSI